MRARPAGLWRLALGEKLLGDPLLMPHGKSGVRNGSAFFYKDDAVCPIRIEAAGNALAVAVQTELPKNHFREDSGMALLL